MADILLGESSFNGNNVETEFNSSSIVDMVERTSSIYRRKVFRKNLLAAFSCALAIVLLILKCVTIYRTNMAVLVGRHLSDGGSSPAHEGSGLCDPGGDSNFPSTSSAPTPPPEDKPLKTAAEQPKLDTSPTEGTVRPSVIQWAGPSSGADSGKPDAPSRKRRYPTTTESRGTPPGTSQLELDAAKALLQFSTEAGPSAPDSDATAAQPSDGGAPQPSPFLPSQQGVSASFSYPQVPRPQVIQSTRRGRPQDFQQWHQQLPTPSTSAAMAAPQSSGAAGPSTPSAPSISDQPSTSSAPSQVLAPTEERKLHAFARLPKVPPGGLRRPFNADAATDLFYGYRAIFPVFLRMRDLLGKEELDSADLSELTLMAEQLVSYGVSWEGKDVRISCPSRALRPLGQRFLMLYYLVSTLQLLGERPEGPWWQRFIHAIPHTPRASVPTFTGRRRISPGQRLAIDLNNAIEMMKHGIRPENRQIISLMRGLFCQDSSAFFSERRWDPWRQDEVEARTQNYAED